MNINKIKTKQGDSTTQLARSIGAGALLLTLSLAATPAMAAEVTCANAGNINADSQVNCFKPNTPAKSAEVNANFERLLQHIASLQQSNTSLQQSNTGLQQDVSNLQQNNTDLQQRLAALEAKLTPVTYNAGQKKLQISGVNVQIVNGQGSTDMTNGTGNLIIGYNAAATREVCSNGSGNTAATCGNNGIWAANQRQGSHNIVIGDQNQYTQYGGLVTGYDNAIVGEYASISGGEINTASGRSASVSGGRDNTASSRYASVSGGRDNTASGNWASVSGGADNTASGSSSSVSGGVANKASGDYFASVIGGSGNTASGSTASVSGGAGNTASGENASISGGYYNTASGNFASVIGGQNNTASADYSIAP